ncbi:MAG: glycosyltransferase family 4 protein [Spirochaetales bacterium]|nr:glycosyltransferase family 4 protein [Spirochaetales bacterium]
MKIVYMIPGSGNGFYCENCRRDLILIKALRKQGHDVSIIPLYLPVPINETDGKIKNPVFYGAVKYYLLQTFPLLKKMPAWLEKILDSKKILSWAESMAGTTRSKGHEKMTLSMLRSNGDDDAELDKLLLFLDQEIRPDIIHISNSLLIGMGVKIKKKTGLPLVCTFQDEHVWIDGLASPYKEMVWIIMNEQAENVDHFISVSEYYRQYINGKLKINSDKISVIMPGIEQLDNDNRPVEAKQQVIGFFSRMNQEHGLEILTEAFILLKKGNSFPQLKLYITGGYTRDDTPFIKSLQKRLKKSGTEQDVLFLEDVYKKNYNDFFGKVTVLSVPIIHGEAFGLYLLEALKRGIPVVQPDTGSYHEIIDKTGGGILYSPNTKEKLAESLAKLLKNPDKIRDLGKKGKESVNKFFLIDTMATRVNNIYTACIKGK